MMNTVLYKTLCLVIAVFYFEADAFSKEYISPKDNANKLYLSGTKKYKTVDETDSSEGEYFKGKPGPYPNEASLGLGFNYFDSFGLQARYAARILEEGFLPDINDAFFIEGAMGPTFYGTVNGKSGVVGLHFLLSARWDFRIDSKWVLFGDLGFGYNIVSEEAKSGVSGDGLFPAIGVGGMYNFTEEVAARLDFSYQALSIGAVYRF